MRRLLLLLLLLLLAPGVLWARSTHGTPDAATESQAWWGDMAHSYVVKGCLPAAPASGLVLTIPPCQAYGLDAAERRQHYIWEETARTFTLPGDGRYWLAAHASSSQAVSGWTRIAGTHYLWRTQTAKPLPPDRGVRLAQVIVASGAVTQIGDFRPDNPLGEPINLLSALYGVTGDCVTDDTVGIQQAINAAAWQDRRLWIPKQPGECYAFTRLWLDHHPQFNPGFPSVGVEQGNLTIECDQQTTTASNVTGPLMNTYLKSTDPTGPALNADKVVPEFPGNQLRNVFLKGCSIEATNTERVVDLRGLNSMSRLENLYIVQKSIEGGGMLLEDVFLIELHTIFIYQHANGSSAAGLIIRNADNSGGVVQLDNVTANGWNGPGGTCVIFGHTDLTEASLLNAINGRGVQGIGCDISMRIAGGAVAGVLTTPHIETATDTGLWITHGARNWTIIGAFFYNPAATRADVRLGNVLATAPDEANSGIVFINPWFNIINAVGVLRDTTINTVRTTLIGAAFVAKTPGVGIGLQCALTADANLNGLTVIGAGYSGLAENTKNCERLGIEDVPNAVRVGSGLAIGPTTTVQLERLLAGSATLDFGVIGGGACSQLPFAVPGSATGDVVTPQWPGMGAVAAANLTWMMYVSAAGTVMVRACNVAGAASADLAAGQFGALVWRQETAPVLLEASIPETLDLRRGGGMGEPTHLPGLVPRPGPALSPRPRLSAAVAAGAPPLEAPPDRSPGQAPGAGASTTVHSVAVPVLAWMVGLVGTAGGWLFRVMGVWLVGYLLWEFRPLRRLLFAVARRLYGRSLEE